VLYLCTDVTDGEALQKSFTAIRTQFHELHGVIYAAGNSGARTIKLLTDITVDDCEEQLRVKTRGLFNLAHVLSDWTLDFCLVCSSNASILGGIGSIAYTGAHLFADAFVLCQAKHSRIPWLTINWDSWLPVSETDASAPFQTSLARYSLSSSEGVGVLQSVLRQVQGGQVIVSRGELEQRIALWLQSVSQEKKASVTTTSYVRPELATAYAPPNNKLEEQLIAIWQEFLGIEQIGIHDNFFDLGGNSLIGLSLIARLNETFKMDIPVVTLFEKSTITALAKVIDPGQSDDDETAYDRAERRARRRKERRDQKGI
jgi:acyl carrier protein